MVQSGFNKFFWGFLFIMINFRVVGVDIMPDIIGYILFTAGFRSLARHSPYFVKGKILSILMSVISVFMIYVEPSRREGFDITIKGEVVGVISLVLLLVIVYYLLKGIKHMADKRQRPDIAEEAEQKWTYFLIFQIAALFLFAVVFLPQLLAVVTAIAAFVAAFVLMVVMMRFMLKCGERLLTG